MDKNKLYNIIFETLCNEDKELSNLSNRGIFYAPELYISFLISKKLKEIEKSIFKSEVNWIRERNFGGKGPTDFAYEFKNSKNRECTNIAFELKVRQTTNSYISDIKKLQSLESSFKKYFIALVDSWKDDQGKDFRIDKLEKEFQNLERITPEFKSFETMQSRYKKEIECTVCIWEVN